jgi:hypothetical protein
MPVHPERRGDVTVQAGVLFSLGDATELQWFAEGRQAMPREIMASIDSGLPLLREAAELEHDREATLREIDQRYQAVRELVIGA